MIGLLVHACSALVVSRCGAPTMMAGPDAAALCAALHAGEPADGLSEALSTRPKANAFFTEYFKSKLEFDADAPPTALQEGLEGAPESVIEVMLLKIVQCAAAESEVGVDRAVGLVNAVWDTAGPVLPQSCVGLRDAIDAQLGAELKPAEDASGGNEEMTRATWDNLLGFMNFEEEDFERAKEATARCGPGREVPKAGI